MVRPTALTHHGLDCPKAGQKLRAAASPNAVERIERSASRDVLENAGSSSTNSGCGLSNGFLGRENPRSPFAPAFLAVLTGPAIKLKGNFDSRGVSGGMGRGQKPWRFRALAGLGRAHVKQAASTASGPQLCRCYWCCEAWQTAPAAKSASGPAADAGVPSRRG